MSLRKMLLAATILAIPAAASAQPVTGLYIGLGAGANFINNPEKWDISGSATPGNFSLPSNVTITNAGKANFKTGWIGAASIGWGFGNGFRAEIEGNFRSNEVDSIRGSLAPVGRTGGFQYTYGAMANVLYDFDFANFGLGQSIFQPYVGVGAGYAWTEWRNIRGQSNPPGAGGAVIYANDTDAQFAYQAIVGVGTPLTWLGVTGLTLTAEYRFFGTLQPEISTTVRNPVTNVPVTAGKIEPDNFNHSVMLGLRYALFQPPPPPPPLPQVAAPTPAPAPVQPRSYRVFFDWDRADLTARAREIIAEAAGSARRVQSTRIEVAGYADRSGSAQYNQRLSQRRADAVAAELVRQGISRSEIAVSAYGESRPLVPTADGVREAQNRRVEIVLN